MWVRCFNRRSPHTDPTLNLRLSTKPTLVKFPFWRDERQIFSFGEGPVTWSCSPISVFPTNSEPCPRHHVFGPPLVAYFEWPSDKISTTAPDEDFDQQLIWVWMAMSSGHHPKDIAMRPSHYATHLTFFRSSQPLGRLSSAALTRLLGTTISVH